MMFDVSNAETPMGELRLFGDNGETVVRIKRDQSLARMCWRGRAQSELRQYSMAEAHGGVKR
jgi:hypothetical protein